MAADKFLCNQGMFKVKNKFLLELNASVYLQLSRGKKKQTMKRCRLYKLKNKGHLVTMMDSATRR